MEAAAKLDPAVDATFEGLVLDFLAYLELERGLSQNPLQSYRSDLLQFGAFLAEHGAAAESAGPQEVSDFLTGLANGDGDAPAATATIRRKAASLRSFYRHLRREGVRESDPTASLSSPRRSQKLPNVLGRAEMQRLLEQPKGTDPIALRDRALLELMYACGLRASEAIELEPAALDLRDGIVRVTGKGSKARIVPGGRAAAKAGEGHVGPGRPAPAGARAG